MTAKEHYDQHLGNFYVWMAGDFETKVEEQTAFFKVYQISPLSNRMAIDLGAGHGIQTVALARQGYKVTAIDFNKQLVSQLTINCQGLEVEIIEEDLRQIKELANPSPELIVCWGDTLTHLQSHGEIVKFICDCVEVLAPGGKLILSFRNYLHELVGDSRFIPVKSDHRRILTGFLEYFPTHVRVTDLFYELTEMEWIQKVSSYYKVRLDPEEVISLLKKYGLSIIFEGMGSGLFTIIALK